MAGQELLGVPKPGQILLLTASCHHLIQEQRPWQMGIYRDDRGQIREPGGGGRDESQGLREGPQRWVRREGARIQQ